MRRRLIVALLALAVAPCSLVPAQAPDSTARYNEIRRAIRANRYLSAHMTMAVDARTIKSVRKLVTEQDIPVLVRMMADRNYGVASAASGLLATLGQEALPALREASQSTEASVAGHARDALALMEQCYQEPTNPDVCPTDRPGRN